MEGPPADEDDLVLMFVFWYCHKRGKEVRLAKEAEAASTAGETGDEEAEDTVEDDEDDEDERPAADDEKYQAMLRDVESKANALNQPDPAPSGYGDLDLGGREKTA